MALRNDIFNVVWSYNYWSTSESKLESVWFIMHDIDNDWSDLYARKGDYVKHTVDTKTVIPALRQTVTAISTTNAWCIIFKRESFNIKVHIVHKISVGHYIAVRPTKKHFYFHCI